MKTNEEKLEMFHKDGMMFLILGCLISADNLINVDSCEKALAEMKRFKEALPNANIEEEAKKKYLEILYTNPCGMYLTARMTTNYQQLKTIYQQRRTHRLPEWGEFCDWCETLPHFMELCFKS